LAPVGQALPRPTVRAGSGLAEIKPRVGIAGRPDRVGKLVAMAAEKVHGLGPVKDKVNDHPLGVLWVCLQLQLEISELIGGKGNLDSAARQLMQRSRDL
jgi:hypothetical protein